jgi:nitrogen fixation protein NifX
MSVLRVAVASSDGITVNEHFGRAKSFHIYEVDEGGSSRLLEERPITPHCSCSDGVQGHSSDATVEQLSDVNAVLVAQIGPGAEKSLSSKGIKSFALGGPVEKALSSYGRRHKLLDVNIPGLPPGYSAGRGCGCSSKKGGGGCK